MTKLAGKVAIISGSGRGIGREIAVKLAGDGASVVVNDLDADVANDTVAALRAQGADAVACAGDVTEPDFGERFVGTAVERFGGVDIIVNNAGYTWDNVVQNVSDEQWYAMLDIHMTAPFRILRAAAPVIREAAKAERANDIEVFRKVVNISSLAGIAGNAGQLAYGSAKAGVNGITCAMAKEWGRYKVNVNSVAFGLIHTRLTATAAGKSSITVDGKDVAVGINPDVLERMEQSIPLGRGGTATEAANAVYLLCIPESNYISGHTLICSGGFMF